MWQNVLTNSSSTKIYDLTPRIAPTFYYSNPKKKYCVCANKKLKVSDPAETFLVYYEFHNHVVSNLELNIFNISFELNHNSSVLRVQTIFQKSDKLLNLKKVMIVFYFQENEKKTLKQG